MPANGDPASPASASPPKRRWMLFLVLVPVAIVLGGVAVTALYLRQTREPRSEREPEIKAEETEATAVQPEPKPPVALPGPSGTPLAAATPTTSPRYYYERAETASPAPSATVNPLDLPSGTGPLPTPAATPNPLKAVDGVLDQLAQGNLAFNSPETMTVKEPAVIQLVLSASQTAAEVAAQVTAPGRVESTPVKISSLMQAHLVGAAFQIQPITPEEQPVGGAGSTEWKWEIQPLMEGKQTLHLTVNAIVKLEGTERQRAIKTFDKVIDVQVAPARISLFSPYGALGAIAAVALLAGVVFWLRRGRRAGGAGAGPRVNLPPAAQPDLFISYSRKDQSRVAPIVEMLSARGLKVWMDQSSIEGASQWAGEITEAIRAAKVFVLMASRASFASENVMREITLACDEHKTILPIYLEPAEMSPALRYQLAGIQHIELHNDTASDFERILRALARSGLTIADAARS